MSDAYSESRFHGLTPSTDADSDPDFVNNAPFEYETKRGVRGRRGKRGTTGKPRRREVLREIHGAFQSVSFCSSCLTIPSAPDARRTQSHSQSQNVLLDLFRGKFRECTRLMYPDRVSVSHEVELHAEFDELESNPQSDEPDSDDEEEEENADLGDDPGPSRTSRSFAIVHSSQAPPIEQTDSETGE